MTPRLKSTVRVPTLLALLALLTACGQPPLQQPGPAVEPAKVPRLPKEARQPPTPAWCLPTCSSALTAERENWQRSLTNAVQPAQPASAPTTR